MKETIENCEAFWIWIAKAGGEGKRIISVRPTDDGNAIEVTYADMKETYNPISHSLMLGKDDELLDLLAKNRVDKEPVMAFVKALRASLHSFGDEDLYHAAVTMVGALIESMIGGSPFIAPYVARCGICSHFKFAGDQFYCDIHEDRDFKQVNQYAVVCPEFKDGRELKK